MRTFFLLFGVYLVMPIAHAEPATLVLYTYDSFVAKDGLGPAILPGFEKKCGCQVKALASGDGAQLLTRVQLDAERGKPGAALVVGLDQAIWPKLKSYAETDVKPPGEILPQAQVGDGFIPYDYGVLALMMDTEQMASLKLSPPARLRDLLRPEYRRNFVLEDPRASTPGLMFLLFADKVFGAEADGFWAALRSQWLTLAPGWDAAYGLFLKGEAPLVWSYTTSQAYHEENGDGTRYRAVVFEDGNPAQIEGAALVKGGTHSAAELAAAHAFLAYLVSPEVQAQVMRRNWMLPVVSGIALPPSFEHLPAPKRILRESYSDAEVTSDLAKWRRAVSGAVKGMAP